MTRPYRRSADRAHVDGNTSSVVQKSQTKHLSSCLHYSTMCVNGVPLVVRTGYFTRVPRKTGQGPDRREAIKSNKCTSCIHARRCQCRARDQVFCLVQGQVQKRRSREEIRVPHARTALSVTVVPAYAIGTSEGRGGKRGGGKQYFVCVSESMLLEHIPSPKTEKLV